MWSQSNVTYAASNIQETIPFVCGSVMVWGCVSHDSKLDLVTVQGNLNGKRYQRDILETVVVTNVYIHALATKPVFMDDKYQTPFDARSGGFPTVNCNHYYSLFDTKRTCRTFWVDEYVRASSSPNVSKTVRSTAPGMVGNSTTSDPTSGLGHGQMY